jgi:acetyltransferase-like isoleucine patch superfamily enzyme
VWNGILTHEHRVQFARYGNEVFAAPGKVGIRGGNWEGRTTRFETPLQIREGDYDLDFVGAFSYFGGRASRLAHVGNIGRFFMMAGDVTIGHAEHPVNQMSCHPIFQGGFAAWSLVAEHHQANAAFVAKSRAQRDTEHAARFGKVQIGNDVWIGQGAYVRRGVTIGDGAIVAARSLVLNDVPPYTIVAGSPAKLIRTRFARPVIEALLELRWWDYGLTALAGIDPTDIETAICRIGENIRSGRARPYHPAIVTITKDGEIQRDPPCGEVAGITHSEHHSSPKQPRHSRAHRAL